MTDEYAFQLSYDMQHEYVHLPTGRRYFVRLGARRRLSNPKCFATERVAFVGTVRCGEFERVREFPPREVVDYFSRDCGLEQEPLVGACFADLSYRTVRYDGPPPLIAWDGHAEDEDDVIYVPWAELVMGRKPLRPWRVFSPVTFALLACADAELALERAQPATE